MHLKKGSPDLESVVPKRRWLETAGVLMALMLPLASACGLTGNPIEEKVDKAVTVLKAQGYVTDTDEDLTRSLHIICDLLSGNMSSNELIEGFAANRPGAYFTQKQVADIVRALDFAEIDCKTESIIED